MKRRLISQALVLSAACSALFLAGCVTTETRIAKHPEMYQRLSAGDQALVQEGKIRNGMARDAVYLAWGGPDQTTTSTVHGKPAETWIYTSTTSSSYPYPYGWRRGYYGGYYGFGLVSAHHHHVHTHYRPIYDPLYDPFYYSTPSVSYPDRTVSFQNGRVVAYQFLAPPRVY
ncbi:MAG: hypothetical protein QOH88_3327 [Verrucomicrobiota bacterium]|jgi:hypothetical protein